MGLPWAWCGTYWPMYLCTYMYQYTPWVASVGMCVVDYCAAARWGARSVPRYLTGSGPMGSNKVWLILGEQAGRVQIVRALRALWCPVSVRWSQHTSDSRSVSTL
jgi:hypothetical protein